MLMSNVLYSPKALNVHTTKTAQNAANAAAAKLNSTSQPSVSSNNLDVTANKNNALSSSRWFHMDRMFAACESDPEYAKKVAEELANAPDRMILNFEDAPSPADADAWNAWVNQSVQFDKEAEPINAQRIELYNSMKAEGKSGIDIVRALVNFNGNQPIEYQIKTGFIKIDTSA